MVIEVVLDQPEVTEWCVEQRAWTFTTYVAADDHKWDAEEEVIHPELAPSPQS
jgi:hypothetical protein